MKKFLKEIGVIAIIAVCFGIAKSIFGFEYVATCVLIALFARSIFDHID